MKGKGVSMEMNTEEDQFVHVTTMLTTLEEASMQQECNAIETPMPARTPAFTASNFYFICLVHPSEFTLRTAMSIGSHEGNCIVFLSFKILMVLERVDWPIKATETGG
jgi:hypothetical protein